MFLQGIDNCEHVLLTAQEIIRCRQIDNNIAFGHVVAAVRYGGRFDLFLCDRGET